MKKQIWLGGIFVFFVFLFSPHQITRGKSDLDPMLAHVVRLSMQRTANNLLMKTSMAELQVASAHTVQVEELNYTAYVVKIWDSGNEAVHVYWYDANGNAITEQAAFDARATAYESQFGHLSQSLYTRLESAAVNDLIPVAIWAEDAPGTDVPVSSLPYKVYQPIVIRNGSSSCNTSTECVVNFIESRGYSIHYISSEVPVVYASLPAMLISSLQSQPYVAAIFEQVVNQNSLYSAARTSAAPWTWSRGITGAGVKVAVLEVPELCGTGGSSVSTGNPYISASSAYRSGDKGSDHATMVAGTIASKHPTHKGIAYDATILSANAGKFNTIIPGLESDIIQAADWAIKSGADVLNASFGSVCGDRSITSQDKYFDWVVWEKNKTVVAAAGNLSSNPNKPSYCPWNVDWTKYYCPSNYNVSSPGKAYNVITVGAKDDKNTAQTEVDTKDDVFSYFSLYVDPETTSSNRLKPEVVAVGQSITTTSNQSPWIGEKEVAGTSFAAPIVAGEAALMMQRSDWLKFSPEAVKAGIMATARWTSLKDDADPNKQTSMDKMGVGAIDTTAADNSLINGRIQGLYLHKNDFNNGSYEINFTVTVPERIRVIIVWSSHPSRIWITDWILHDRLESDFDLTVSAPNGQVFGSYADEANYEIVEFMAPVTGNYRARIHLTRWDQASMVERIGFAWYSGVPLP